ncbi:MAG: Uncharacterised protein [Flavobacterium sp. SCGC AAA160-P02]|nr:MAG: Uncharacterised protein [Flavobacterium sp. SCGC AAA160-P02]
MLKPIDIHNELIKERKKNIQTEDIIGWVYSILNEINNPNNSVLERLAKSPMNRTINNFNIDNVDTDAIFHISQIEKICINYRLRFLDTRYFKGSYPDQVVEKIQRLEDKHQTILDGFKIIAPSKLFRLDKADDPLLFAPMGNGYYYLIHKWGTDLHPLRKIKYWSIKNVENLGISIFVASLIFTILTKDIIYHSSANTGHLFMLFLFYIKGVLGLLFLFGASSGKNFSEYCWQSKYDKIT